MILSLQQLPGVRGPAKFKFLAPDAADALMKIEDDTGRLIYNHIWWDAVLSRYARHMRRGTQLPAYSTHNYGLGVDLDVPAILQEKKITYEDLVYVMRKRGWYAHRRDGVADAPESGHFNFLGSEAQTYLDMVTLDPSTWFRPGEQRIWERYGRYFVPDQEVIQRQLHQLGFFHGEFDLNCDFYMREAVIAFQRAWDLVENGIPDLILQRVLAFVAAERQISPR